MININILYLKINSITASTVNIGQALQADYSIAYKANQGYGQSFGDHSNFMGTQSAVDDKDMFDANVLPKSTNKIPKVECLK